MKRTLITAFLLLVGTIALAQGKDWAKFYRYAASNDTLLTSGSKVRAVILGDSITDNWLKFDRPFFTGNAIAGRGISGQVTSQMLVRFRDDVIALKPKYVAILAGTNDIALNNGPITLDHVMGNIISMCELAKAHRIKVILCSVLPASKYKWRPELTPAEDIKALNAMIEEYAAKNRITYLDFWTMLANGEGGLDSDKAPDGVHPNLATYKIMEEELLKAIR